jgi:hypothetical protein
MSQARDIYFIIQKKRDELKVNWRKHGESYMRRREDDILLEKIQDEIKKTFRLDFDGQ